MQLIILSFTFRLSSLISISNRACCMVRPRPRTPGTPLGRLNLAYGCRGCSWRRHHLYLCLCCCCLAGCLRDCHVCRCFAYDFFATLPSTLYPRYPAAWELGEWLVRERGPHKMQSQKKKNGPQMTSRTISTLFLPRYPRVGYILLVPVPE